MTVDGSGSTWTNGYNLYVGYSGDGNLEITNGGTVSNGYYYYQLHRLLFRLDGHGHRRRRRLDLDRGYGLYVGYYGSGTLEYHQRRRRQHYLSAATTSATIPARPARSPSMAPARLGPTAATSTSATAAAER